ncbi:hypothetical protein ES703_52512 [subsurface metagenome]
MELSGDMLSLIFLSVENLRYVKLAFLFPFCRHFSLCLLRFSSEVTTATAIKGEKVRAMLITKDIVLGER